jgi:hypothetical protein
MQSTCASIGMLVSAHRSEALAETVLEMWQVAPPLNLHARVYIIDNANLIRDTK